jgi:hypothetical protein
VLSSYFGDQNSFSVTSDVMLGVTRSFSRITAATDEIRNARVFAGIHFRTATNDGQTLGTQVADWVQAHSLLRVHGDAEEEREN